MTVQTIATVQSGVEIMVPLNKLKTSPLNARRTPHKKEDIETLAAAIAAKGVLQPPVVAPEYDAEGVATGFYLVSIGEGRRLALGLLAKRKQIAKAEPIRCLLDETQDAFEISLDENVTRFAMHPADQFEAFRDLAEHRAFSAEAIALRFGVSTHTVRQRLRLGTVSPALLTAYREERLTLEQLMAFGVSEDHARQEQVFSALSYNRSPSLIRRMMTEAEVPAEDRRAVFVGAERYTAAGGRIRRDLFADDQGGWFEDVGLLDRLVQEGLDEAADCLRREEGWLWAEARLDYPHDHGCRRIYPLPDDPDPTREDELHALGEEYDGLIAECGDGDIPPQIEARLHEIDIILRATIQPRFSEDTLRRGGLFAVLDWDGSIRIERGFIRPEDEAPLTDDPETVMETVAIQSEEGVEPPLSEAEEARPLSDKVVADLTAHRTAALRDRLASDPETAILAVLHAWAAQTFYNYPQGSCLKANAVVTSLAPYAPTYPQSRAGIAITARSESWSKRLPENASQLWEVLAAFTPEDRLALFAHIASLTVCAVQGRGLSNREQRHADQLAAHLDLDMRDYWSASVESYFGQVSKRHILDAVGEAKSLEAAEALAGMKKEAMAKAAADLLGLEGWLPPLLRSAAAPSA